MNKLLSTIFLFFAISYCSFSQVKPDDIKYESLKREGKIKQSKPTYYNGRYPVFNSDLIKDTDFRKENQNGNSINSALMDDISLSSVCQIDSIIDSTFSILPANDDGYTAEIPLNFSFNFFGDSYNSVFINNNGNISFGTPYYDFTSTGFPSASFNMIAPFWADVDTRGPGNGLVYYKQEASRLIVVWHEVGYFPQQVDKLNTFKLIITDGNDPIIGIGNNVAFMYGDMQWTTGSASGGSNGFGGTPATVGFNKGSGSNACYFFQLGRFDKPGSEFISAQDTSGIDYLDYKCFYFDVSQLIDLSVDFTANKSLCAVQFYEAVNNPHNYNIVSYYWDFGDGTNSAEENPNHVYENPGTYRVSLSVVYEFGNCSSTLTLSKERDVSFATSGDLFEEITVNVHSDLIEEVISTSATTFSDTWPLEHLDQNLAEKHAYKNGSKGIWRAEASYVYDKERNASLPVNIAADGTFTLEQFNWEYSELEAIPNWLKANEITMYSPYSYELENRDVLGNYSAALYDYGGQVPSANGINMHNREMAFTGFEYMEGEVSGNWRLQNESIPLYQSYKVKIGARNIALVEAPIDEFELVGAIDVYAKGIFGFGRDIIGDNAIICKQPYDENPDWTLLSFERPVNYLYWTGSLIKRNNPEPLVSGTLDETIAHSGKKSLKVSTQLSLNQELFKLEPGKKYMINAWVSVNNPHVVTPDLGSGLGITLSFKDKEGTELLSTAFTPSGPVIEGWQQIKGKFIYPGEESVMEITFKPGSTGAAWYDDLRLHPVEGNMQSYVYDIDNYRLTAILDENNYASFYYYDAEGNLYLVKKETIEGIKTISENTSYIKATAQQ